MCRKTYIFIFPFSYLFIVPLTPSQSHSIGSSTSGSNSWYKALTVKTTLVDNESGIASAKYCVTTEDSCTPNVSAVLNEDYFEVSLETNANAQKICVNTTDKVGNTSDTTCSDEYKVDAINPTQSFSVSSSTSGSNGWYKALTIKTTLAVKVTDTAGRVSGTVTATATVKNYVNLYNNGTTHSLVGGWIKGNSNTVISGWKNEENISGAVNSNNIQLSLTGFRKYSAITKWYRAVGYRTKNKIDVSNYSQMCLVYDLVIPSFSHVTNLSETSAAGFRFSLTSSTTDWYNSKTADTGFWTQDGNINFSNTTICSSLSSTTGSWYPLFQIDSNASAYGASVTMTIHQLYLIPN